MQHVFLFFGLLLLHLAILSRADQSELRIPQRSGNTGTLKVPRRTLQQSQNSAKVVPLSVKGLRNALKSEKHCKDILDPSCPYRVYQKYRSALLRFPLDKIPDFFFERLPVNKFFEHDQITKSETRSDFALPRLYGRAVAAQSRNGTLPTNQTKHIIRFFHSIRQSDVIEDTYFYTVLPLAVSLNEGKALSRAQVNTLIEFGLNLPQSSLLEPKCFLLWILAFQLEAFSCKLSNATNLETKSHVRSRLGFTFRSVEAKVESIKSTHQDLYNLYKQLLHVNFLQAFRDSRSYPETVQQYFAQRGETNWLKGIAEMLELWPFSKHPYGKCSTFSCVAYRLLAHVSAFNPIDSAEIRDALEELFVMIASNVEDYEMSSEEISLITAVSLYTKVFELPESFLLIRPRAIFVDAFRTALRNLSHIDSGRLKASTLFRVSKIAGDEASKFMLDESFFLKRAKESLKRCSTAEVEDDPDATVQDTPPNGALVEDVSSTSGMRPRRKRRSNMQISSPAKVAKKACFQACKEHFLFAHPNYIPLDFPNVTNHQSRHALNAVLDDLFAHPLHTKGFILPSLDENMLARRVEHFNSHQVEGLTGDMEWRRMSPDHAAFDDKIMVFAERMFSALGWLVRKPQNSVYIYFEDSFAYGSGLEREAFSIFSKIIALPFVGIFRYDEKAGGLLPLPMLSSIYMALLAVFHVWMLNANLRFELPLAPSYLKFLSYSEPFDLPIESVIKQLYAREFEEIKKMSKMRLTEYYPPILRDHYPIALDYPEKHRPASPFSFANPLEELEKWQEDNPHCCEIWQLKDPPGASASLPEFVEGYTKMLHSNITDRALGGRFEYQRHFLSRIKQERWPHFSHVFFEKLMRGAPRVLTADELYSALCFADKSETSSRILSVIDDDQTAANSQSLPILRPEEAFKRVLSGYSPKMLLKLLWFCTGCYQVPFHRLKHSSISVEMRPRPLNGVCMLPFAKTCHLTILWTVQSRLSEVRRAFDYVLENASGFTIDELRADEIVAHARARNV